MEVIHAEHRFKRPVYRIDTYTWVHHCKKHPDLNGKTGLQKIRCHIEIKCPFCGEHPPE